MTNDAARRVADALVADGLVAPTDIDRAHAVVASVLGERREPAESPSGLPRLVEVLAYLGTALVLAAAGLFLAETWDELGGRGQVAALVVIALVLAAAGTVTLAGAARHERSRSRARLASTLLTGASGVAALAVGRVLDLATDYDFDEVYWPAAVGGFVFAVGSVLGYRVAPTALGQLGVYTGLVVGVETMLSAVDRHATTWSGVVLLATGCGWVLLAELGHFRETGFARVLGVLTALSGAQFLVIADEVAWLGYLLTAAVAGAGVALYLTRLDLAYLAVAVVAVTLVVPEAVTDWTDGSIGVIGAVLVAGLTLLAASFAGYRIREQATG